MSDDDWRNRVAALIEAVQDVRRGSLRASERSTTPSPQHLELYRRFVEDLRRAKQGAEKRWDAMVATEFGRAGDLTLAERTVAKRNSVGRVADPGVIAILRRYWLACQAINLQLPQAERVGPEHVLLGLLLDSPNEDLARFLSELPYWPVGLDREGRWV